MPFPLTIAMEVVALNNQITAAQPLESAPSGIRTLLATQATTLASDIEGALADAAGDLDTFSAPMMAPAMVLSFLEVADAASTQVSLADLAGVVGRVASNLTNG